MAFDRLGGGGNDPPHWTDAGEINEQCVDVLICILMRFGSMSLGVICNLHA